MAAEEQQSFTSVYRRLHHRPSRNPASSILILACGNRLRGDDGAGLLLGAKLAEQWHKMGYQVRFIETQQWVPELTLEITNPATTAVFFVDACIANMTTSTSKEYSSFCESAPTLQIVVSSLTIDTLDSETSSEVALTSTIGHHLDPTLLLLYARELYQHLPKAWLVTVPGLDFVHSEGLSPSVHALVNAFDGNALLHTLG